MKQVLIYLFATLLILSCSNKGEKDRQKDEYPNHRIFSLGSDFSPFLNVSSDSIVFVFSKRIAFDTSWILVVKKSYDGLHASYNHIIPSYHRDVHDFLDESDKLLTYEGLVFDLNNDRFKKLIAPIDLNKFNLNDTTESTCTRCPYYTLYYNNQFYSATKENETLLHNVATHLKSNLLNHLLEKKLKPRW